MSRSATPLGQPLEVLGAQGQLGAGLRVVAPLAAGAGGPRPGPGAAGGEERRHLGGGHPVGAGTFGASEARASSMRAVASSRLTSWPFSRFQMTNPQPGFLRLFQLVQP